MRTSVEHRAGVPDAILSAETGETMFKALASLEQDHRFLDPSNLGLAVLFPANQPDRMTVVGLDFRPEESVSLAKGYTLAPLMRLVNSSPPRKVLALSDGGLRLLEGTARELSPMRLPAEFPQNRDDVMKFEAASGLDPRDSTQHRVGHGMAYHGEGPKESVALEISQRYYRLIGDELEKILSPDDTVLLAGTHDQISLFRRVNPDLPLLRPELSGNFESTPLEHFEHQALTMLRQAEEDETRQAVDEIRELSDTWWSQEASEALEAARRGKIHRLYLSQDSLADPSSVEIALEVLRHRGTVQTVEAGLLDAPLLAHYRWSDAPETA